MSNQLLESCEKTFKDILDLLKKKNSDYAGEADTYKNFLDPELQEYLDKHGCKMDAVELGIRVRLKDKWARINTLLFSDKGPQVAESLDDTLRDMMGYSGIWMAWREFKAINSEQTSFIPLSKRELDIIIETGKGVTWKDYCICGDLRGEHAKDVCTICGCTQFYRDFNVED